MIPYDGGVGLERMLSSSLLRGDWGVGGLASTLAYFLLLVASEWNLKCELAYV